MLVSKVFGIQAKNAFAERWVSPRLDFDRSKHAHKLTVGHYGVDPQPIIDATNSCKDAPTRDRGVRGGRGFIA